MSSSYRGIETTEKGEEKKIFQRMVLTFGISVIEPTTIKALPKNNFNCRFSDSDPDTARQEAGRGMKLPVFLPTDASTNKAQFK